MSLLDTITGGKSSQASADYQRALEAIQAVQTPNVEQMKYKLQQLVQAGIITPDLAKTYLQNPSAFQNLKISQTGTKAQENAIAGLENAASAGGLNPAEQAQLAEILQQLGTQERGANEAVVQNQAARGALTGGETLAAQLGNNQQASVNANANAMNTAGQAYQQMLNELTSAGTLGSGLQGQENTQANTVAAATDAINRFNAAQQQQEENFNTQNKNEAQLYNTETAQNIENKNVGNANEYAKYQAQLPEEVFQNQLQKAEGEAGAYGNKAANETQQGGQQAGLIGGLVGTGGEVLASGMAPTPQYNFNAPGAAPQTAAYGGEIHDYLKGGIVDGKAHVSGDSLKNDTVPARLSPGEIVLPRTVAQNPQPDRVMAFLNRIRKPKTPHPDDVATVLHALDKVRNPNAV